MPRGLFSFLILLALPSSVSYAKSEVVPLMAIYSLSSTLMLKLTEPFPIPLFARGPLDLSE